MGRAKNGLGPAFPWYSHTARRNGIDGDPVLRVPRPLSGEVGSSETSASEKPSGPAIVRTEPLAGS